MVIKYPKILVSTILAQLITLPVSAESIDLCMQRSLVSAPDTLTIGELRESCLRGTVSAPLDLENVVAEQESAITRRLRIEREGSDKLFSLQPHKPNYIMLSNNMASANEQPFTEASPNRDIYL